VRAHPGPTDWGQDHYGVIRKLHPNRAATRGVLLGRLRSYERRGSARQTGLRPCVRSRSFSGHCEQRVSVWVLACRPWRSDGLRPGVRSLSRSERAERRVRCRSWRPEGEDSARRACREACRLWVGRDTRLWRAGRLATLQRIGRCRQRLSVARAALLRSRCGHAR
jgi:hypothetical protein